MVVAVLGAMMSRRKHREAQGQEAQGQALLLNQMSRKLSLARCRSRRGEPETTVAAFRLVWRAGDRKYPVEGGQLFARFPIRANPRTPAQAGRETDAAPQRQCQRIAVSIGRAPAAFAPQRQSVLANVRRPRREPRGFPPEPNAKPTLPYQRTLSPLRAADGRLVRVTATAHWCQSRA